MFELLKDVDKYKGIPPYASELYGIHQSLLGWRSRLTRQWMDRNGFVTDPRIKKILDGRIKPGPTEANIEDQFFVHPLVPGSPAPPFKVVLARNWNSQLLGIVRGFVQEFLDSEGRLPQGEEWEKIIDRCQFDDADKTVLKSVRDYYGPRLRKAESRFLAAMQFESQVAEFLIEFGRGRNGHNPDELAKLFVPSEAAPLEELFRPTDPLAEIDPKDIAHGALSPVGYIHIFRQYFFDLGSFLGEPVEHIWLAPGTTIELVETSSRRALTERTLEELIETSLHTDREDTLKDELSEAVRAELQSDTKFGVSTTETLTYPVFQGEVTANFGTDSSRKESRETAHTQNRERTEKVATDLKGSVKTIFRTTVETIDTRSRRYVIQNTNNDLVNIELRRKMRRVGVQLQDIGTRLGWQLFIDDPGLALGLSEMVDIVGAPDLSSIKRPDQIVYQPVISKVFSAVQFTYKPKTQVAHKDATYVLRPELQDPNGAVANREETSNPDEQDEQIYIDQIFRFDPPQPGYECRDSGAVAQVGVAPGKVAVIAKQENVGANTFRIVLSRVNFAGDVAIPMDFQVSFVPVDPQKMDAEIQGANKKALDAYDAEKARTIKQRYLQAIQERIKNTSKISSRPSWDLREEERTIIFRKLIKTLMLSFDGVPDSPGPDVDANRNRLAHLRSEVIRSLFDVDAMLYFVAPEWWKPRRYVSALETDVNAEILVGELRPELKNAIQLTEPDLVKWTDDPRALGRPNYRLTADSAPAKLCSSLGWLLQLDGDNLRNAFLNAPWVKAVLPIRPGREEAALNWLRATAEGTEGLSEPYAGTDSDPELMNKTVGEALAVIASRLSKANSDFGQTLAAQKVFETGFEPLAKSFDAGLNANQVFSQWISIVPTDQIVAQKYAPMELFE